jgi:hypothetical protein
MALPAEASAEAIRLSTFSVDEIDQHNMQGYGSDLGYQ